MEHGIFIRGTLLGYKEKQFVNQQTGEVKESYFIGIGISKTNEFGSKTETLEKIRLNKNDITTEFIRMVNELKQKTVEMHIGLSHWEMNGKSGLSLFYISDFGIKEVK